MKLEGKVALITGAARGLGRAYAEAILERNGKVSIVDVLKEVGERTERELRAKYGENSLLFISADVRNKACIKDAFEKTLTHFGRLDVVINNAAVQYHAGTKASYDINIFALMRCTELAVEYMSVQKEGNGGIIVNISSIAGLYTYGNGAQDYQATKHAVLVYSRGLAALLSSTTGIRFVILCPGPVKTEFMRHRWDASRGAKLLPPGQKEEFWVPMENVAEACMRSIEDDSLASGSLIKVMPTGVTIPSPEDAPVLPLFSQ